MELQGTVRTTVEVSDASILKAAIDIVLRANGLNEDQYIDGTTLVERDDYGHGSPRRSKVREATATDVEALTAVKVLLDLGSRL